MANIDKTSFVGIYGIDDDDFINYLNTTKTLKNLISLNNTNIIPIKNLNELYNRFVYYKSIGYNNKTIYQQTVPLVRNLFFASNNEYLNYIIPCSNKIDVINNKSYTLISGRYCEIVLNFTTVQDLAKNDYLYTLIPIPLLEFNDVVFDNLLVNVSEKGIRFIGDSLPTNTSISGSISYMCIMA